MRKTSVNIKESEELIAPCGMNCALCSGYLANKYNIKEKGIKMPYCTGCRPRDKICAFLKKSCKLLLDKKIKYCYECGKFSCDGLKTIDKRYRERYRMSMIDNLNFIREKGIGKFLLSERKKWQCPGCGEFICCHNGLCFRCNLKELGKLKNKYRWEQE
jgi:hypothetical protein